MTLLTHRGEGPGFPYAGQPMHILAGHDGEPAGFAAMEITIPPYFAGPIPHAHDEFDEAIYVLTGRLRVIGGDEEAQEATAGSMFTAPRGHRHGFSNPYPEAALVLGIWAPAEPALAFMEEVGAALSPSAPPDPGRMRDIYARHASRLLP
jgi:quercetin dioxygenase-like cupin family protein